MQTKEIHKADTAVLEAREEALNAQIERVEISRGELELEEQRLNEELIEVERELEARYREESERDFGLDITQADRDEVYHGLGDFDAGGY